MKFTYGDNNNVNNIFVVYAMKEKNKLLTYTININMFVIYHFGIYQAEISCEHD